MLWGRMRFCGPPVPLRNTPDEEEYGVTLVLSDGQGERTVEHRTRGVLTVLSGVEAGTPVLVEPSAPLTLGRAADCSLSFVDQGLSRVHAMIRGVEGRFIIEDQGSRNGTFVNGLRIREPTQLADSDRISLGAGTSLKFSLMSEAEEEAMRRSYEAATRDALTEVFNRRQLEGRLPAWVEAAQREGQSLSLAMIDIDHFKRVNDSYGHLAGDEVLRATARLLREGTRSGDLLARYGGEEFTLVMRADALTLGMRVDQLRQALRQRVIHVGEHPIQVTCSAGVASLDECSDPSPSALLQIADRRLYEAKRAGRDRVVGP